MEIVFTDKISHRGVLILNVLIHLCSKYHTFYSSIIHTNTVKTNSHTIKIIKYVIVANFRVSSCSLNFKYGGIYCCRGNRLLLLCIIDVIEDISVEHLLLLQKYRLVLHREELCSTCHVYCIYNVYHIMLFRTVAHLFPNRCYQFGQRLSHRQHTQ